MAITALGDCAETARSSRRDFVLSQIRVLGPLEFVTFVGPSHDGFAYVEVSRDERDDVSTVEVGGAPPPGSAIGNALEALGFAKTDPGDRLRWKGSGAEQVGSLVASVLDGPLAIAADAPLDVRHGSRRAEVELERRLVRIRERIRSVVGADVAADAVTQDPDGDYSFPFESTRVWVGTRVLGSAEIVVRVFALAAADIDPSPALGLYLAQANFVLTIGKFSLDPTRRVVWFEEALLGEAFSDDELRGVIRLVAVTANEYDDQIAHMFGGRTRARTGRFSRGARSREARQPRLPVNASASRDEIA